MAIMLAGRGATTGAADSSKPTTLSRSETVDKLRSRFFAFWELVVMDHRYQDNPRAGVDDESKKGKARGNEEFTVKVSKGMSPLGKIRSAPPKR